MSFQAPTSRSFNGKISDTQLTIPFDQKSELAQQDSLASPQSVDAPWVLAAELSPVPMRITDTRAQVIFVNSPWLQFTGMPLSDAKSLGWLARVEEDFRLPLLERLLAPSLQGNDGFLIDYCLVDPDGNRHPVREMTQPRFSPSGTFLGHASALVDLSTMANRPQASDAATSYDPTISAAAAMVHDIAPALTAAITYNHAALKTLKDDPSLVGTGATAQLSMTSKHLQKSSELLRRLRDILSKGQAYFDATNLHDLIRGSVLEHSGQSDALGIQFIMNLPDIHASVMADALQIQKVMSYLLEAAMDSVKGVTGAKILVQLDLDSEGLWRVLIRHNGVPLREHGEDSVFSTINPAKRGQPGLGLSISQSIIRGHNGRLWYEAPSSTERNGNWKGGTMIFVLPPCRPL